MKYVASIRAVREVVLQGTARAEWWTEYLAPLRLAPALHDNSARVFVGVFGARWMGLAFREAVVSVEVRDANGTPGQLLLQGYNSRRFFAWAERVRFKTPYRHARMSVAPQGAASFDVQGGAGHVMRASMAAAPTATIPGENFGEIVVHLPGAPALWFQGCAKGTQATSAFDPAADQWLLSTTPNDSLHALIASNFVPRLWRIGTDAKHARSKTLRGLPSASHAS